MISKCNTKVACPSFNKACFRWENGTTCKGCYALKSYRQYPSVRALWDKNAAASPIDIIQGVTKDLFSRKTLPEYFRIHSSGEFTSCADIMTWVIIAEEFPTVTFYGYSKEKQLFKGIKLPHNLIIRVNAEKNYGTLSEMHEKVKKGKGKYWLCPCGQPGVDNKSICGKRCRACMLAPKDKLPLFVEH